MEISADGRPERIHVGSYEQAREVLSIVDDDRISELAEYCDIHNMAPTAVSFDYSPGSNPRYTLSLEPCDDAGDAMVEEGVIDSELTGETSISSIREVRERLGGAER